MNRVRFLSLLAGAFGCGAFASDGNTQRPLLPPPEDDLWDCPECGMKRGSSREEIAGDSAVVEVRCACQCEIVCERCGMIDLEHWLGPWYFDEEYGRVMHKAWFVPPNHRCPDGLGSNTRRRPLPGELAWRPRAIAFRQVGGRAMQASAPRLPNN